VVAGWKIQHATPSALHQERRPRKRLKRHVRQIKSKTINDRRGGWILDTRGDRKDIEKEHEFLESRGGCPGGGEKLHPWNRFLQ